MRIAVGVGLALAFGAAWIWRGEFANAFLSLVAFGAGAGLFATWLVLRVWSGRRGTDAMRRGLLLAGVLLAMHAVSWPAGHLLNRGDVRDARTYCELVIQAAEQHRNEKGTYPHSWEELAAPERPLPRLLDDHAPHFVSDGDAFVLSFSEEDALLPHTLLYSSADGAWQRF